MKKGQSTLHYPLTHVSLTCQRTYLPTRSVSAKAGSAGRYQGEVDVWEDFSLNWF